MVTATNDLTDARLHFYAGNQAAPEHEGARAWLDERLNGTAPIGLPWSAVLAFVRLATNPVVVRHPASPADAWRQVEEWLGCAPAWTPVPDVFSPSCVWCDRNLDNARRLESHVAGKYQCVAVALESKNLREYVAKNGLEWTIVANISPEVQKAYGMAGTPQTILIDSGGTVRHVWSGAFLGGSASEIEQVFGVKLPGLKG